jgi:radical SAM-linked protein
MQRIRIHFGKGGPMRFTGHLDLMRAWERLLRRARLPVAYSQGFNPRPRINLAAALPLGFTSDCEFLDVQLDERLELDNLLERVQAAAPPGLRVYDAQEIELKAKSPQSQLMAAEYRVALDASPELASRVENLLVADTLPRERRGKAYDLRSLVEALSLDDHGLWMRLTAQPNATGRPDEVLLALGLDPLALPIHRTLLLFQK